MSDPTHVEEKGAVDAPPPEAPKPPCADRSGFRKRMTGETKEGFLKWCKKKGVFLHPDVSFLHPIEGMGNGVVAMKKIAKGTSIVTSPRSVYIAPTDTAIDNAPSAAILAPMHLVDDFVRVVLRLMAEVCRGKASPWAPWIRSFGLIEDHLLFCPPEQLAAAVRGTDFEACVADMNLDARWAAASKVIAEHPDVWPEKYATRACFLQCVAQVMSRNFHMEKRQREGPFLLPGIDLLNHSPTHCSVDIGLRGSGGRKGAHFVVDALRDIEAGEQIFYDYDSLSNARLLFEFNFTLPPPYPNDKLRFSAQQLTRYCAKATGLAEEEVARRVADLTRIGILFVEGAFMAADGKIPVALANAVCLLGMPQKEYDGMRNTVARWWEAKQDPALQLLVANVAKHRLADINMAAIEAVLGARPLYLAQVKSVVDFEVAALTALTGAQQSHFPTL